MLLYLCLPLWIFEVVTRLHYHPEKILTELLAYQLQQSHRQKVQFHVYVQSYTHYSFVEPCWNVLYQEIFIVNLYMLGICLWDIVKFEADVRSVVNGMTVDKYGFVVVESVVSDSLKDGLPCRKQGQIEETVSYLVISIYVLFFFWLFYWGDQLIVQLCFSHDGQKYLHRYLYVTFHENSNCSTVSSWEHLDSFLVSFALPALGLQECGEI